MSVLKITDQGYWIVVDGLAAFRTHEWVTHWLYFT